MKDQDKLYQYFANLVSEACGIQLGEKQKRLVETRLQKRWRDLGLTTLDEYHQYFLSNSLDEKNQLISLLTTHHTYFFREFAHFEFILQELPKTIARLRSEKRNVFRIWSAASSHGEEAYSLAMFLSYHLKEMAPDVKVQIFGSDVCEASVAKAKNGVYTWEELKKAPRNYISGKWLRGSAEIEGYVCAKKELKDMCQFKTMNLFEIDKHSFKEPFDIIFCRNVFIYFTSEQIKELVGKLMQHLCEDGHFIVGLSESLMHLGLSLGHKGKSIYCKTITAEKRQTATTRSYVAATTPKRIVCVDDSDVVLKLMQRMFDGDSGYKVVGIARNGEEAAKVIAEQRPDYVTLDIHMPVLDGVSYLKKYYSSSHPAVLIVSSVSREEKDLAQRAIEYGARDYVEKPSLATFSKAKEEILAKLGAMPITRKEALSELEKDFSKTQTNRKNSAAVAIITSSLNGDCDSLKRGLNSKGILPREFSVPPSSLESEFFNQLNDYFHTSTGERYLFILGKIPVHYYSYLRNMRNLHTVFVEDERLLEENIRSAFSFKVEVCPATSMVYEYGKVA